MDECISYDEIKKNLVLWKEKKDEQAIIWLITTNYKLIYCIAKKYIGKGLSLEELKSAGLEGLVKAICRFNYNHKNTDINSFRSYMSKCIENQMITDLKNNGRHKNEVSIDLPINSSKDGVSYILEEVLQSDDKDVMEEMVCKMEEEFINDALKLLSPKERKIICSRYGLEENDILTLNEIGKIYNCSRQAISVQEQKALKKMRTAPNANIMYELICK